MANTKTITVLVPVVCVELAGKVAKVEKRSRNSILSRWLQCGMQEEVGVYFAAEQDVLGKAQNKKNRGGVGAGEAQGLGTPVGMGTALTPEVLRLGRDKVGAVLTQVEAEGFGTISPEVIELHREMAARAGAPDPVFGGRPEIKVPDEAVRFAEAMQKKVEAFSGTVPDLTVEAGAVHRDGVPPTAIRKIRGKAKGEKIAVADSGFQHDSENCHVYGCLMCKAAKEGR